MDNNTYWDTSGESPDFSGRTFEEWQSQGNDTHSIIADPGFIDPKNADFRLKPNAAALNTGFKPFDYTKAGLYGEKTWVTKPKNIERPMSICSSVGSSLTTTSSAFLVLMSQ